MANVPSGRKKNVSGTGSDVHKKGEGLGTGPVGQNSGSNQIRPEKPSGSSSGSSSGGPSRAAIGGGGSILVIIVLFFLLRSCMSGGRTVTPVETTQSSGGSVLESLINYNLSGSSSFSGWGSTTAAINTGTSGTSQVSQATQTANNASNKNKLDTTVASGSRSKYTTIKGGGQDTITLMVYMCGTDLESNYQMATKDLQEMAAAPISNNINIIIYTGGAKKWSTSGISSTKNQVWKLTQGSLTKLEEGTAVSMVDYSTLGSFIRYCATSYPADRYDIILWDHGGGSITGYGYDEKYPTSSMTLSGLKQAFADGGVKFDFIGFDACLMATVENGLMLSNYADYMIASEETEPGIGWYYTNWLTKLSQNTSMPTTEIGKNIVDDFVSTCGRECRGQSATLSVVDLAELSNTAPEALKGFSNSLTDLIAANEYKQVSDARNASREFAQSSVIDQIDLVDFAGKVGNDHGQALSDALLGAVKYNRTSSNMTGSYGLSIYFPYRKTSNVDSAVKTYDAIGMDESYARAIQEFASLEVCGQAASGGSSSVLPSLLGNFSSSSYSGGSDAISDLLGGFLGGDYSSVSGLSGSNTGFLFGRSLTAEQSESYISDHFFDGSALTWKKNSDGNQVIALPETQWELVEDLDLNLFYDDGAGYIDLGLDNVFDFDDNGNLLGQTDRTWIAVNGQIVAYYHEYTEDGTAYGYIPAMLNGDRVELIVMLPADGPGSILGARSVYLQEETDTVAKSTSALEAGDTLDFLCDYYSYEGVYQDSYYLGEPMTVTDNMQVTNADVGEGKLRLTYRFTDLYQQHYWTEALEG